MPSTIRQSESIRRSWTRLSSASPKKPSISPRTRNGREELTRATRPPCRSAGRLEGMHPAQLREAREVAVAGGERAAVLDRERGEIGVGDELAVSGRRLDQAREERPRAGSRCEQPAAAPPSQAIDEGERRCRLRRGAPEAAGGGHPRAARPHPDS